MEKIKRLFHRHKFTWTPETKDWFFTGKEKGHIGSVCKKCGKLSDNNPTKETE